MVVIRKVVIRKLGAAIRGWFHPEPILGEACPKCHATRLAHYRAQAAKYDVTEAEWPMPEAPRYMNLAAHDRRVHGGE
jgi:hypothetical protein